MMHDKIPIEELNITNKNLWIDLQKTSRMNMRVKLVIDHDDVYKTEKGMTEWMFMHFYGNMFHGRYFTENPFFILNEHCGDYEEFNFITEGIQIETNMDDENLM